MEFSVRKGRGTIVEGLRGEKPGEVDRSQITGKSLWNVNFRGLQLALEI